VRKVIKVSGCAAGGAHRDNRVLSRRSTDPQFTFTQKEEGVSLIKASKPLKLKIESNQLLRFFKVKI
jgi:hypothetical protein